jgi:hypothetical protein
MSDPVFEIVIALRKESMRGIKIFQMRLGTDSDGHTFTRCACDEISAVNRPPYKLMA